MTSLDTKGGCGCALHFKSREQQVIEDVLRVPGAGGLRRMASSSSQMNTVGCPSSTVKPVPQLQQLLESLLPLTAPSRAREQQRQQGHNESTPEQRGFQPRHLSNSTGT